MKPNEAVIICRRAIDWSRFRYSASANTVFNKAHPVAKLVEAWDAANPDMPFTRYRQALHEIALSTWDKTGATILFNWLRPDEDDKYHDQQIIRLARRAKWVVPIDDDDWLAPSLCENLTRFSSSRFNGLTWKSAVTHVLKEGITSDCRTHLDPQNPKIVLSCSYAVSAALISKLSDAELSLVISAHGHASGYLQGVGTKNIDETLAAHIRHRATAGAASFDLSKQELAVQRIPSWANLPKWMNEPMKKLQKLHEN